MLSDRLAEQKGRISGMKDFIGQTEIRSVKRIVLLSKFNEVIGSEGIFDNIALIAKKTG